MLLMTGAAAAIVVKEEFADAAGVPLAFADTTSKSYRVLAAKPVSVIEWLVTSAVFTVVEEP
jgi:hypothetical protein